jgi:hypothetical protein
MKRSAIAVIVALVAMAAVVPSQAGAQQLLYDYVGFDYEFPNPDPSLFGEIGSGYQGVGEVPVLFAPLVSDQSLNEYTYYMTGLTSANRQVFGDFVVINYAGPGTITVYEDSRSGGTPFDYGVNPPSPGFAPDSFVDGSPILVGSLTNFVFVFNTTNNSGSYEGDFEAVGGTQFGNIPANQRKGWTFSGGTGNSTEIPGGYLHQIDGQVFLNEPVPTKSSTLGGIKALYR